MQPEQIHRPNLTQEWKDDGDDDDSTYFYFSQPGQHICPVKPRCAPMQPGSFVSLHVARMLQGASPAPSVEINALVGLSETKITADCIHTNAYLVAVAAQPNQIEPLTVHHHTTQQWREFAIVLMSCTSMPTELQSNIGKVCKGPDNDKGIRHKMLLSVHFGLYGFYRLAAPYGTVTLDDTCGKDKYQ